MKEEYEFRINYKFAHLLFKPEEGKDLGQQTKSVKAVLVTKDDSVFNQIPVIAEEIQKKFNEPFYFYWEIRRKYSRKELEEAKLFRIQRPRQFQPAGEEMGTIYDESSACDICGVGSKQSGPLKLKKGSVPNKDISITIAGELVVSKRAVEVFKQKKLKGILLSPVVFGKQESNEYFQLRSTDEIELRKDTVAGIDPFNLAERDEDEIYKCPKGHTIGLNLLSEVFVNDNPGLNKLDFFATKQKTGVKRGLLRPEPFYLCSPGFKKAVEEEKLTGFNFEVAYIR